MEHYDTIVIGGGAAGLSAALVLGRSMRRTLVCDSGRYRNERSAALHGFLGHDGIAPAGLLERSRGQLARYSGVRLERAEAVAIERAGDGEGLVVRFEARPAARSRTVLVATGVVDEVPRIEGIDALWGRSVHVCPYCDGWEHRGAPVAVYGQGEKGAGLARMLRQWTPDLVLCTDGPADLDDAARGRLAGEGIAVMETPIARLDGEGGQLRAIRFRDGTGLERRALFFNTGQHPRSPLLEGAGCRFEANGGVACDSEGRSSVEGISGDVSRDVQLAVVAAAEGARAALAINKDLLAR